MVEPIIEFLQANRFLFLGAFFACLMLSIELGLWLGSLRHNSIADHQDEGAKLVVGSVLGLLAFVLALNLSTATTRYERRMDAALTEVNAIGTAMLQAQAVGGDQSEAMVAQLRDYLVLRYDYVRAKVYRDEIARINAETDKAQALIWQQVMQRVDASQTATANSLMNAINNVFDASTALRLAMEYRMPTQVILLLLSMSMLGIGAVGYSFGLVKRRGRMPGIVLSLLWCVIVTEILDIGSARIWTFRTDARVYEWSLSSFGIDPERH